MSAMRGNALMITLSTGLDDADLRCLSRAGSVTLRRGNASVEQKGELVKLCHRGSVYLGRIANVVPVSPYGLADVTYEFASELDCLRERCTELIAALEKNDG